VLKRIKIAIVGPGALGSYYGAKLLRMGHEVHFLLRSDYAVVRRKGVKILSPEGNFHINPRCAEMPEEIGIADLVLVALKTTANELFSKLLPPLVGPATIILTLQNGIGNEEQLAKLFPPHQIMGGLCFVCLNRIQPGVIEHKAHGQITLGEYQRWPEPRTHDIATHFRDAGIPCKVAANLEQAHWEKLVWNIPFNGFGVASAAGYELFTNSQLPVRTQERCLTTAELLADPRWSALVSELMNEVMAAGEAVAGHLDAGLPEKMIARTQLMGNYKPSTLVDFERGLPLELDSMFALPLALGKAQNLAMPRLERLTAILAALDPKS
jgi:2-dehydropantoate 2-reductase